jgi:GAF domain-containing protein
VSGYDEKSGGGIPTVKDFARFALEVHEAAGVEETVEAVAQFAQQAVGCSAVSVVLVARNRRPEPVALTDPALGKLLREQIQAGDGPLITTIQDEAMVTIPDVTAETRWPKALTEQATATGFRSAMYLPLMVSSRPEAVLGLHSDQPHAFDSDDLAVAHILAQHASVAIAAARNKQSLAGAVDARKLIGQAQGILMERFEIDADRAFAVMKRYSMDNNRKLRDVAQELIETRRLPRPS